MLSERRERVFIRVNSVILIAVYLLIFVGGVVRNTGSGMGCPDWPKCFGKYVPPVDSSELPENYQDIYAEKRYQKNVRLSSMFSALGMDRLSERIVNDKSILEEEEFNVSKTWVEYLNRLLGALIGLFIGVGVIVSFPFWRDQKKIVMLSLGSLVLVGFIGWVGSIVVSTNLLPGIVTFHMILAIALIGLLIYTRFSLKKDQMAEVVSHKPYKVKRLVLVCLMLFVAQVVLGTQVREAVDIIAGRLGEANKWAWIDELGLTFYIHRSYSLIILGLHVYLVYRLMKSVEEFHSAKMLVWTLLGMVVLEVATGVSMAYFAFPFLVQPLHLLVAVLIFGLQYYLYLVIKEKSTTELSTEYAT